MADPGSYPGTPRWVKAFGAAALIPIVLIVVLVVSGGGHGPGRHMSSPNRANDTSLSTPAEVTANVQDEQLAPDLDPARPLGTATFHAVGAPSRKARTEPARPRGQDRAGSTPPPPAVGEPSAQPEASHRRPENDHAPEGGHRPPKGGHRRPQSAL